MTGGHVVGVAPGSRAEAAGLRPGDVVRTVQGRPLRDLIDWRWYTADPEVTLGVSRGGRESSLVLEGGADAGVEFASPVFDSVRTCENACEFCFVSQLPPGLRESLYVRDDDYRLSFLAGTFVTLTNLDEADEARIVRQRLSPLHVSLHAVDAGVRRRLLCPTSEDGAVERLDRLLAAGIEAHVQIVLVPGVDDGVVLEETLDWLEGRAEVLSVGVVPLGYTAHQTRYDRSYDAAGSAAVLEQIDRRVQERRARGAARWVHAADEFYASAGAAFPACDEYEGFPQFENGIGLVRAFTDELTCALAGRNALAGTMRGATLVTGELFAPLLEGLVPQLAVWGLQVRVLPVANRFFGGGVSVAGLLTGADLVATIGDDPAGGIYLVPDVVLGSDGVTLDDLTARELGDRTGRHVRVVPADAPGFVSALSGDASEE